MKYTQLLTILGLASTILASPIIGNPLAAMKRGQDLETFTYSPELIKKLEGGPPLAAYWNITTVAAADFLGNGTPLNDKRQWTSGWQCRNTAGWGDEREAMRVSQIKFGQLFGRGSVRIKLGTCQIARCYYRYFGICNLSDAPSRDWVSEVDYARDRVYDQGLWGTSCANTVDNVSLGYIYGHDGDGPGRYGDDWRYC